MEIDELQKNELLINQIERLILLNDEQKTIAEHRAILEDKITKLLNQL
jgi:hypothetical protein